MSAARKLEIVAPDPFALIRGIRRMRAAGFAIKVESGGLVVESNLELSEPQRAFIGSHKPALVALLEDSEALHHALVDAGPTGLGWREGSPDDWSDIHLLAVGEVLYGDGRMMNAHSRRYAIEHAPAAEYPVPVEAPETAPHAVIDSPPADPLAARVAELTSQGWSPWNARARAEAETNRTKVSP